MGFGIITSHVLPGTLKMAVEPSSVTARRLDVKCHLQEADYIRELPSEILLNIFFQAPGFEFVRALIHTSHRFSRVFEHNALRIVESVLGRSGIPTQTKSLMRAVVSVRTDSFRYKIDSTPRSWAQAGALPLEEYLGPGDHWRDSPPPTTLLRRFVGLAHNIHILAHGFLDKCLRRCAEQGLPLLPSPTEEHEPQSAGGETTGILDIEEHEPSSPATGGLRSPSWTEEQRVILAIWMAQYFLELKSSHRRGCPELRSCEDAFRQTEDTIGRLWPAFRGELARIGLGIIGGPRGTLMAPSELEPGSEEAQPLDHDQSVLLPTTAGAAYRFQMDCPSHSGDLEGPEWRGLTQQTLGHRLFCAFYSHSSYRFRLLQMSDRRPREVIKWHLMRFVGPDIYRELGMFFWDKERLVALGLQSGNGYYRWLQLVGDDELARARKEADEAADIVQQHNSLDCVNDMVCRPS